MYEYVVHKMRNKNVKRHDYCVVYSNHANFQTKFAKAKYLGATSKSQPKSHAYVFKMGLAGYLFLCPQCLNWAINRACQGHKSVASTPVPFFQGTNLCEKDSQKT